MSVRCKCDKCGHEYWGSAPLSLSEIRFGNSLPPDCPECRRKFDEDREKKLAEEAAKLAEIVTSLTTDRNDPELHETLPSGQNKKYLVLSEEERAKGFVRPIYRGYIHLKCGGLTKMGLALCETYARNPKFYSATYCAVCGKHFPLLDENCERAFIWDETAKYDGYQGKVAIPSSGLGVGE
jgi:hypothetical protein